MAKTIAPKVISIDFETHGIENRPKYPPKPVSLAIHWPGDSTYKLMAWGHKGGGNNCTEKAAYGELRRAYDSKYPLLGQHMQFDLDVAETHWGLPLPSYDKWHDTKFLIFLDNPHAPSLSLKPSAERLLGLKPEEQDEMYAWITGDFCPKCVTWQAHASGATCAQCGGPTTANVPNAQRKPSTAGAYIWECPYDVVKPYHKGDLVRTEKIFSLLYPRCADLGMRDAYERELKLMPILLRNARKGIRCDVDALKIDLVGMRAGLEKADNWLRKNLGIENVDSDKQLGDALYERGVVEDFKLTKTGKRSVSKKYLTIDRFKDKRVYQVLQYRGQMATSINMFAEAWIELAAHDGRLHPDWIQVRADKQSGGSGTSGARSNRIICLRPNLLNIPKKWKRAVVAGYVHPAFLGNIIELPFMRRYLLPDAKKQWGRRDFNQQEVRLYAHFEEGPVMEGFLKDPRFDMHEGVRLEEENALIAAGLRAQFDRDSAKTTVFGAFYGQGLRGLMESLKLPEEEKNVGQAIHKALHRAVPSLRKLNDALKELARNDEPIRTWGGRLYHVEPPGYSEKYGRNMTYEYKLISYLIQGSGADVTKEALVRYEAHPRRTEELLVTVYDENNINLPLSEKGAKEQMSVLKECMESIELDVPMLSDGERGDNWGSLKTYF